MGGIFNIDGPFFRFGTVLWDIMSLSLLWILFSIPLVTIGASTTAVYYIAIRRISKKEGYITRDFWISFKTNFKQSTCVWLVIALMGGLVLTNLYLLLLAPNDLNMPVIMETILLPLQVLLLIEIIFFTLYVFPIISRFNIHGKLLIKTTLLMAHKHLPTTVLLIAMIVLIFIAMFFSQGNILMLLLLFGMGIYSYGAAYFFARIFKKYRPEMDKEDELGELRL